jgi:predicted NAD-dependent protein-ADP-ribosyltransferase YbiA (DUF1768 family)
MIINFSTTLLPFFQFSNLYSRAPFVLDNKLWLSTEQYIQCEKYIHVPEYHKIIYESDTPIKARALGNKTYLKGFSKDLVVNKKTNKMLINDVIDLHRNISPDPSWIDKENHIIERALYAKFSQNQELKILLLGTGNLKIFSDKYPRLGLLLMNVRDRLNQHTFL